MVLVVVCSCCYLQLLSGHTLINLTIKSRDLTLGAFLGIGLAGAQPVGHKAPDADALGTMGDSEEDYGGSGSGRSVLPDDTNLLQTIGHRAPDADGRHEPNVRTGQRATIC